MPYKYNPGEFEKKWQDRWFGEMSYEAKDLLGDKEKYYLLVEFPYPSGPGMHIGHTRNYSMMDAVARLRRMKGQNVMYPMGWDAFGLPTENYAIKMKRAPKDITKENIQNFRKQLKSLGLTFDWNREVNTSDPEYYKWTQWIFLKLYEKGLAYKSELPINWCPKCKVGCSNEEVVDGKHERCGETVHRRDINQWVLKITEYADRLDSDLETVDFLDSVKSLQRNWIGKKTWYDIDYKVEGTDETLRISTTRPDTQFGATFVVISPEHKLLESLLEAMPETNRAEVKKYIEIAKGKSELDRISETKEKTGSFTGLYCINSMTGARLPIYTADFVLASVGTGMVVGVPAHDERDFDFAKKYKLPVIRVIEGPNGERCKIDSEEKVYTGEGKVFDSGFMNDLGSEEARVQAGKFLKEKGLGGPVVRYHLRDWIFSRQHYWGEPIPIVYCDKCGEVPVPEKDLPVVLPDVESYEPTDTGESPLANITDWVNTKCPKCGGNAKRETDTMPNWAGSSWYFLRYCDPNNKETFASREKSDYWMQVDHYEGGQEHITLHLLYSRFWHKFLYDLGLVRDSEPYAARSIHGVVLGEGGVKMSKSLGNVMNPDQLVSQYGADVTRAYMMFMGPYEGNVVWNTRTIQGVKRFVSRYYTFILNAWDSKVEKSDEQVKSSIAKLVKKIEEDILNFKFNTAVASLMEFYNNVASSNFDTSDLETLMVVIAPILPHLSDELWDITNHTSLATQQPWPTIDESLLKEDTVEIPVQINGKVRGRVLVNRSDNEGVVKEKVLSDDSIGRLLSNSEIKKFFYVQNKIVNIVI
jgi:leucyl-tRNA synthetase